MATTAPIRARPFKATSVHFSPRLVPSVHSGGMSVDFTALHSVLQLGTLHAFRGEYARGRSPLNSFDNSRQRSHSQPPAPRSVLDTTGLA